MRDLNRCRTRKSYSGHSHELPSAIRMLSKWRSNTETHQAKELAATFPYQSFRFGRHLVTMMPSTVPCSVGSCWNSCVSSQHGKRGIWHQCRHAKPSCRQLVSHRRKTSEAGSTSLGDKKFISKKAVSYVLAADTNKASDQLQDCACIAILLGNQKHVCRFLFDDEETCGQAHAHRCNKPIPKL